jgi:hypothetical protein
MKFATWFSAVVGEVINIHVLSMPAVAMLLVASQLPQLSSGI